MQDVDGAIVFQYVIVASRTIAGSILLIAGISKISNHEKFAEAVKNYQLLPARLAELVARVLPIIEIVTAVLLLASLLTAWVSPVATFLFLAFTGAVAINLLRGRRDIDCGCFGSKGRGYLTWGIVVRNAFFAGLSFVVYLGSFSELAPISFAETAATMLLSQVLLASWWLWTFVMKTQRLGSPDHLG